MKTSDMMILGTAGAIAVALVFWPKAAAAVARMASGGPLVGRGDGSTVYSAARQAAYREQLSRELASQPDFWV